MEELVRYIASTLVDHPEQVQVKTVDNPESTIIELSEIGRASCRERV